MDAIWVFRVAAVAWYFHSIGSGLDGLFEECPEENEI